MNVIKNFNNIFIYYFFISKKIIKNNANYDNNY